MTQTRMVALIRSMFALALVPVACGGSSDLAGPSVETVEAGTASPTGDAQSPPSPSTGADAGAASAVDSSAGPGADPDTGAASGPDAPLPPPYEGTVLPIAQLPARLAEVYCKKALSCCPAELALRGYGDPPLLETCVANYGGLLAEQLPALRASLQAHRARYDDHALLACLDAETSKACVAGAPLGIASCALVVPMVPEAGACQENWECGTSYCQADVKPPYLKDGTCAARLPLAAACIEDDECQSGSCDFAAGVCDSAFFPSPQRLCGNSP